LPISQRREEIAAAIRDNQVVILAGETGSGKTTQLPKICLELGYGRYGLIGHTQPRRIAARTVAARLAEELKVTLGSVVGYQVRFSEKVSHDTRVKVMTDGILLAEIQRDRFLNRYDVIIIDEAHERNLNIDFLLGYLKQLIVKRPELKLIVTSATIDLERFSRHFNNAPIVEVSGRTFPVDVIYMPRDVSRDHLSDAFTSHVVEAIDTIYSLPSEDGAADILIFVSGERDIRDLTRVLKKQNYPHTELLPLYARLRSSEQNKVFQQSIGRRIVLATNVAETSLTVPGIRYVVDSGTARISRYSARSKVQQLPIEAISQASANQRKGRCGRVAEGVCVRLYEEDDFISRPEFTQPEIQRTNLAAVILQMLALRLGDVNDFPFLEPPSQAAVSDGFRQLKELGAVDAGDEITKLGRRMARLPLDPRFGRILIEADRCGSLAEVLIIIAALSTQDPRERPLDKQQAADEKHQSYHDEQSDFLAICNLWQQVETRRQDLSQNQFRRDCERNYLSYPKIREWREVHRQLVLQCKELGLSANQQSAGYTEIHRALLSGLLGNFGEKGDQNEYLGARNRIFFIYPGSGLFKVRPRWVMAAEMVETTRLYARSVAKIEPEWVEVLAPHLLRKSYSEPHWSARAGKVVANERVSVYGLVIVPKRRVDYSQIDTNECRKIFVQSALVEQRLKSKAAFYLTNNALIKEVEELEHRSRRRDIIANEQSINQFYEERIPEDICSANSLERWFALAGKEVKGSLYLSREFLLGGSEYGEIEAAYPSLWEAGDIKLPLTYQFEPGNEQDGVTLKVPVAQLNQIPIEKLEWVVPGMLRDKCISLVKQLPKQFRKQLVPVPERVDAAMRHLTPGKGWLMASLANALQRVTGVQLTQECWQEIEIDPYFQMNIQVLDERGKVLGFGRDLAELKLTFSQQVEKRFKEAAAQKSELREYRAWEFGTLIEEQQISRDANQIKGYTAIQDNGENVEWLIVESEQKARELSFNGVLRLAMLATPKSQKYLAKNMPQLENLKLQFATLGTGEQLLKGLLHLIYCKTFFEDGILPLTASSFNALLRDNEGKLSSAANVICGQLVTTLEAHHRVSVELGKTAPKAWQFVHQDVQEQLSRLFSLDFLRHTPQVYLQHYPRYLQAIEIRLDKIQNQLNKELQWCREFSELWRQYQSALEKLNRENTQLAALQEFRWELEEYRVSLYAQALGTPRPVSIKRLNKQIDKIVSSGKF